MEYHLVIKRKKLLIHALTWMNPENIVLSLRSHTQKAVY